MITQTSSRTIDTIGSWLAKRWTLAFPATAGSLAVCAARDDTWCRRIARTAIFAISLIISVVAFVQTATAVDVLEEIIEQKYALDSDATLSISNTDGSVRVYAHDAPEISIQAIKKAYSPERLRGIVVDVKATNKSIVINTIFPPRKNAVSDRSGTVDYILVVPQTIRITQLDLTNGEVLVEGLRGGSATAHLVNGWLGGHNCFGDLNLTVVNGRLDVAYDWWETQKFSVKASSTSASLRAVLPSDAAVRISARALTGRIANAFETKKTQVNEVVHSLDTMIGPDPDAVFEMKASSGNIRIDKMY